MQFNEIFHTLIFLYWFLIWLLCTKIKRNKGRKEHQRVVCDFYTFRFTFGMVFNVEIDLSLSTMFGSDITNGQVLDLWKETVRANDTKYRVSSGWIWSLLLQEVSQKEPPVTSTWTSNNVRIIQSNLPFPKHCVRKRCITSTSLDLFQLFT